MMQLEACSTERVLASGRPNIFHLANIPNTISARYTEYDLNNVHV